MIPNKHHGAKAREYHDRIYHKPMTMEQLEQIKRILDNNLTMNKAMQEWNGYFKSPTHYA